MSSTFSSKPAIGPPKPWEDPKSYPAIKGLTMITDVKFADFNKGCKKNTYNYVWMTNKLVGDIIHPTELKGVQLDNVSDASKVEMKYLVTYNNRGKAFLCVFL